MGAWVEYNVFNGLRRKAITKYNYALHDGIYSCFVFGIVICCHEAEVIGRSDYLELRLCKGSPIILRQNI